MPVPAAIVGHFIMCTVLKRIFLLTCAMRSTYAADAERRDRNRLPLNIPVIDEQPFVAKKSRKATPQRKKVECEVAYS